MLNNRKEYQNGRDAIGILKDFLKQVKLNNCKLSWMSNRIYDRYVEYDDEIVIKAIRKVMIIYAQQNKKTLYNALLKWRFNSIRYLIVNKNIGNNNYNHNHNDTKRKCSPMKYSKRSFNKILSENQNQSLKTRNTSANIIKSKKTYSISQKINQLPLNKIRITNEANFTIRNKLKRHLLNKTTRTNYTSPLSSRYHHYNHDHDHDLKHNNNLSMQINPKKSSTAIYKSPTTKEAKEKIFASLYNDSKARQEKLKHLNIEKEKKFRTEYTFTPEFKTKNKRSSSHYLNNSTTLFFERLQFYDQNKKNHLQRISQDVIESKPKPKQCKKSPEPHLITNGKEYRRAQREKRRKIEQSILEEQGVTFKPFLNDSVNNGITNSVIERNKEFIKNKEAKLSACRHEPDKNCTFKPMINYICIESSPLINTDPNEGNIQIGKRLYEYQSKYLQNLELKRKEYEEVYPFKPKLSKNTNDILYHKQMIKEEIKKKYDNRLSGNNTNNKDIQEEPSQNETEDIKNHTLNIHTITSENNSLTTTPLVLNNKEKKMIIEDNNSSEEQQMNAGFTAKCDNTSQKKTKVTLSAENMSDEQLMKLAKNFVEVDDALEIKSDNQMKSNTMIKHKPIAISEENEYSLEKEKEKDKTFNPSKPKSFMKDLNYYDKLK